MRSLINVPLAHRSMPLGRILIALVLAVVSTVPPLTAMAGTPSTVITFEDGSLVNPVTGVTRVVGNVVLDNTFAIKGTYAAGVHNSTDAAYLEEGFPGADDVLVSFYVKLGSLPPEDVRIALISNSGASVGNIVLHTSGALRLRYASTMIGAESAPLAVGTIYRVGIRQKRGAGADAVLEGYLTTGDDPFGAPFASTTTGSWTSQADRLRFGATTSEALDATFDDIALDFGTTPAATQPAATDTLVPPTSTPSTPTATQGVPSATPATPTPTQVTPTVAPTTPAATQVTPPPASPDPLTCAGYPEPRVFLESQAWWRTTPGKTGPDHGHVHIGTCFPYAQKLSGNVNFDIRVILHDNPGTANFLRVQIAGDFGDIAPVQFRISQTCTVPGTCTFWYHVTVDTTKSPYDGRQEFRFAVKVAEPDGTTMFPSTGWQAYLNNGKPVNDYRSSDLTIGYGWYTGTGYANAQLDSKLPMAPVSGLWSFKVSLRPGASGIPVTHHVVLLDANLHANIPGTVLVEGSGAWSGTITLDTRTLPNGLHHLLLRSDADAAAGSTNSGVLVFPFTVQNP
jgi:hypothetical protein